MGLMKYSTTHGLTEMTNPNGIDQSCEHAVQSGELPMIEVDDDDRH